jgi:hypothetical protein
MHAEMIRDGPLGVAVLLNSFGDLLVPFAFVHDYTLGQKFVKRRPVRVALALRYFRNVLVASQVICEAVNKVILAEKCLALDLIPDGLSNTPLHESAIFFLCLGPRSTELSEYPIRGEARVGRLFSCRGPVAGPFTVFGLFNHFRADRIQDNITADFEKVRVLLDEDGLVPALEKVAGLVAAFVPRLRINAVQLPHAEREISIRRFYHEVIMIVHEAVCVAYPVVAFVDVDKDVEKGLSILVVLKDAFFIVAATCDVIHGSGEFYAKWAGHEGSLSEI